MKFEFAIEGKLMQLNLISRLRTRSIGLTIAFVTSILFGARAQASCTAIPLSDTVVNFPAVITVPANVSANTVLASINVPVTGATVGKQFGRCPDSKGVGAGVYWRLSSTSTGKSNRTDMTTSIPGISYRATLSGSFNGRNVTTGAAFTGSYISNYAMDYGIGYQDTDLYAFGSQMYVTVSLVTTGAPIGSGPLSLNPIGGPGSPNLIGTLAYVVDGTTIFNVTTPGNVTTINSVACSVTNQSPKVKLAPVKASVLGKVGSTAGSGSVSLDLNCPSSETKVFVTLTDNSNPANRSNTLALTPDSTASGVALQVLDPTGTPIKYGPDSAVAGNTNQWLVGPATTGPVSVPLTVQYIQTGATVKPGTVNGVATFTMSYQ